jgi:DNA-binding protein YbaB
MAKRPYRSSRGKKSKTNPNELMSQFQTMQEQMAAQQEALAD